MLTSILASLVIIAISAGAGYGISNAFWKTDYSRTNKSGDGGGPLGGVWAVMSGVMISLILTLYVGKYFIAESMIVWTFGIAAALSMVAGFLPAFRRRK
jgi:hypothetical protein